MLTRLNGIEAIWERLQVGRHVGNQGANRTRVRDLGAHETIVSLALLSLTASCLADQRRQAGVALPPLGGGSAGSGGGRSAGSAAGSGDGGSAAGLNGAGGGSQGVNGSQESNDSAQGSELTASEIASALAPAPRVVASQKTALASTGELADSKQTQDLDLYRQLFVADFTA